MRSGILVALVLLLFATATFAYIRITVSGGVSTLFLFQESLESIQFHVEDVVAPDMRNADNRPVISPTSESLAVLQAVLDAWSDVPHSCVCFELLF